MVLTAPFRTRIAAALLCGVLLAAPSLRAAEIPASLQVAILVKVLVYDRTLATRARDGLLLGVVYDLDSEASRAARDKFVSAFAESPREIAGKQIELVELAEHELAGRAESLDIVYVAPGSDIAAIVGLSRKHRFITFASDRDAVQDGVVMGVVSRGDKPKLLINVGASVASGMELDPQVLRLAELVRGRS